MREGQPLPCPKITREQTELTPEQAAYARQFVQEHWVARISTKAVNEEEVAEHLRAAYQIANVEPPALIRWFDSPVTFIQAYYDSARPIGKGGVESNCWGHVWGHVRDHVQHSVEKNVSKSVRDQVWDIMTDIPGVWDHSYAWDDVKSSISDAVRDHVWKSVRNSVLSSVWDNEAYNLIDDEMDEFVGEMWDSVWESMWNSIHEEDRMDLYNFYPFFHEIFEENELIHLSCFNEMVWSYQLGRLEAWLVRKPTILSFDEQGRLHSESGRCLQFRDGWGFYAWHGVRRSEQIILPPE